MIDLINDENAINLSTLTFKKLRHRYGTGRAYTISGEGRNRKTGYRAGIMTSLGDIEISIWERLVYKLIVLHNEQELFRKLMAWCAKNPFLKNESDRKSYALQLHAARIFEDKNWVDYNEFKKGGQDEKYNK